MIAAGRDPPVMTRAFFHCLGAKGDDHEFIASTRNVEQPKTFIANSKLSDHVLSEFRWALLYAALVLIIGNLVQKRAMKSAFLHAFSSRGMCPPFPTPTIISRSASGFDRFSTASFSAFSILARPLAGGFHPVFNRIFIIGKEFLKSRNRIRV